eukprot:scaffold68_cov128-Isochrysis_galbana.AAC.1
MEKTADATTTCRAMGDPLDYPVSGGAQPTLPLRHEVRTCTKEAHDPLLSFLPRLFRCPSAPQQARRSPSSCIASTNCSTITTARHCANAFLMAS